MTLADKSIERTYIFDAIVISTTIFCFSAILILLSYFGNPINDESFPFAIALRFINGQQPFVDDMSPFIPIGLLFLPLVKLSLYIHGGKNELILFMRQLFIIFQLLMGIYVYSACSRYLPRFLAFFCAAVVTLYHPFGANFLHYDTLCIALWSGILFQLCNFQLQPHNKIFSYFLFSCLNMMLCLAYPTFIILLVPLYLALYTHTQEKSKFWLSHIIVGTATAAALAMIFFHLYDVKYSDIVKTIQFNRVLVMYASHQAGLLSKILMVLNNLIIEYYRYFLFVLILMVIARSLKTLSFILPCMIILAMTMPLAGAYFTHGVFEPTFYFFNCIGFLPVFLFFFFMRQNNFAQTLMYVIWIPSFCAGLLTSITSSNLDLNFNVGFFPASILSFVFGYFLLQQSLDGKANAAIKYWLTRTIVIYGLVVTSYFQLYYTYGSTHTGVDQYIKTTKYTVPGAFNGLYMDSYLSEYLQAMQKSIKDIDVDPNKYIYFGPLSGGYLLVDKLKPGDYILYCAYNVNHHQAALRMPSYIFHDLAFTGQTVADYANYIPPGLYKKIHANSYYEIYYASGV